MNDANSAVEIDPKAIFLQALDCESPAELARFLDESCADIRRCARGLTICCGPTRRPAGFLGGVSLPNVTFDQPVTERPGTIIGPYKLLEQIGEGGMGWCSWPSRRNRCGARWRSKSSKPGMDTQQVVARFEAERQALALMDHRHIAKVLDAGTTDNWPALLRDGTGPRRSHYRVLRPAATHQCANGWNCLSPSARRCSMPIKKESFTAT